MDLFIRFFPNSLNLSLPTASLPQARYVFLHGWGILKWSCLCMKAFIKRDLWSGTLINLFGISHKDDAMVLNYLVLSCQIFVSLFRLTSMMEPLFLSGMVGRIFNVLVSLVKYRFLIYSVLFHLVQLPKHSILGILIDKFGLIPTRRNTMNHFPVIHLML